MQKAQVKYVVVDPEDLPQLPLDGQQVLMVNGTGEMSAAARERVRRFVTAGGFLTPPITRCTTSSSARFPAT